MTCHFGFPRETAARQYRYQPGPAHSDDPKRKISGCRSQCRPCMVTCVCCQRASGEPPWRAVHCSHGGRQTEKTKETNKPKLLDYPWRICTDAGKPYRCMINASPVEQCALGALHSHGCRRRAGGGRFSSSSRQPRAERNSSGRSKIVGTRAGGFESLAESFVKSVVCRDIRLQSPCTSDPFTHPISNMDGAAMLAQRSSGIGAASATYARRPLLPVAASSQSASTSSTAAVAAAAVAPKPLTASEIHINAMFAQFNVPESLLVIRRGMVRFAHRLRLVSVFRPLFVRMTWNCFLYYTLRVACCVPNLCCADTAARRAGRPAVGASRSGRRTHAGDARRSHSRSDRRGRERGAIAEWHKERQRQR
jgi:hypothetical protein